MTRAALVVMSAAPIVLSTPTRSPSTNTPRMYEKSTCAQNRTNQTQEVRVYSHDGSIGRSTLTSDCSQKKTRRLGYAR
eukprot:4051461-Pyramimonas_sp.AAC.2